MTRLTLVTSEATDAHAELRRRLDELARGDTDAWLKALDQIHDLSHLIACNEAQPVGIRELARAFIRPVTQTSLNATAIVERSRW